MKSFIKHIDFLGEKMTFALLYKSAIIACMFQIKIKIILANPNVISLFLSPQLSQELGIALYLPLQTA